MILFKPFVALLQHILEPDDGIFRRVLIYLFFLNLGVAITYNLNDEEKKKKMMRCFSCVLSSLFILTVDEWNKILYFFILIFKFFSSCN